MDGIVTAWGRILRGYRPALSVEITRECPLRCPGCYAYGDQHLGGEVTLRQVSDYKGDELVDRFLKLMSTTPFTFQSSGGNRSSGFAS
jgi:MoaA/NifB/PqqE/SkfB family radical SAM enzyme